MKISELEVYNFRSYKERKISFTDGVTTLSGPNGIGKTNLLEAVYLLLQGRSFRDSDEELILHGAQWWKVRGKIDGQWRELRYYPQKINGKELFVDETRKGRFTYRHQLPVVLFEPDDLHMIHAGPSTRRSYMDMILTKIDPLYRALLSKYERALLQRNNLLKRTKSLDILRDTVFVWDVALSEYGAQLMRRRQALVMEMNEHLTKMYSTIANKNQTLTIEYHTSVEGDLIESSLLAQRLSAKLSHDQLRGFTSVGPHRDDLVFILNGKPAQTTASRGEVRSILLALKQLEVRLITMYLSVSPIVLLDDVLSELDEIRQKTLLTTDNQIILTTTHRNTKEKRETLIVL